MPSGCEGSGLLAGSSGPVEGEGTNFKSILSNQPMCKPGGEALGGGLGGLDEDDGEAFGSGLGGLDEDDEEASGGGLGGSSKDPAGFSSREKKATMLVVTQFLTDIREFSAVVGMRFIIFAAAPFSGD